MEEIFKQINTQDLITTLVADGLLGLVFGFIFSVFLAQRIGKSISDLDRTENRREQRRAELQKAIDYIDTLIEETNGMQSHLPGWLNAWDAHYKREIGLTTPFWDHVKLSGDLPRLFAPALVKTVSAFYGYVAEARRGRDLMQQYLLTDMSKMGLAEEFNSLVINSLNQAIHDLEKVNNSLAAERVKLINELQNLDKSPKR